MRDFLSNEETRELCHELENNEVEYEVREHNRIYVNITNEDTLEGIYSIKYEPYWHAWKVIWFYLDSNNQIRGDKTIAFSIEQILECILG